MCSVLDYKNIEEVKLISQKLRNIYSLTLLILIWYRKLDYMIVSRFCSAGTFFSQCTSECSVKSHPWDVLV